MATAIEPRRPEPDLTVLWQRHIPEGTDLRMVGTGALGDAVREELRNLESGEDQGDLVVIIARRPPLAERVR